MKRVVLTREVLDRLKALSKYRKLVVVFSADYGCAECEVFEELLESSGLAKFVDYFIVIPNTDDAVELALESGISAIPLVAVYEKGAVRFFEDPDPRVLLEKLESELQNRVAVYKFILDKLRKHAEGLSSILGKRVVVDEEAAVQLVYSVEVYGKPYCPCRVEKSERTLCPCQFHVHELKTRGKCRCGVFKLA